MENQEEQKLFITTEEILHATLNYLASKPYSEVQGLIDALRKSKPYEKPIPKQMAPEPFLHPENMEVVSEEVVSEEPKQAEVIKKGK